MKLIHLKTYTMSNNLVTSKGVTGLKFVNGTISSDAYQDNIINNTKIQYVCIISLASKKITYYVIALQSNKKNTIFGICFLPLGYLLFGHLLSGSILNHLMHSNDAECILMFLSAMPRGVSVAHIYALNYHYIICKW